MEPNGITCTALISACEKGQVEKAIELHSDLAIWAEAVITYNARIMECARCGKVETALELLEEMQQRGLAPDVITYIALISACIDGHKVKNTFALFAEMQQRGVRSDLIKVLAKKATRELLEFVPEETQRMHIRNQRFFDTGL